MPRVAVVTRTQNRLPLLRRCLTNVAAQGFEDYVQVVVNDGGDAAALDAMVGSLPESTRARLKVLHNPVGTGRWPPANRGVRAVDSELVTLLDDDDTWEAGFLATMVDGWDRRRGPNVGGLTCRTRMIDEEQRDDEVRTHRIRPFNERLRHVTLFEIAAKNLFTVNAFVYARSAYDAIGGYREDLPVLGDWDFNLRFVQRFDVDVVPATLANWHVRMAAATQSITGEDQSHRRVTNEIRNALLRSDLTSGRPGLGTLNAMATGFDAKRTDLYRSTRPLGWVNGLLRLMRPWNR